MEIIELPTGTTVTEPGAYRCDLSWYHSSAFCDGPSISSSMARAFFPDLRYGICPANFWAFSKLNPDAPVPEVDPPWMAFGSAAHALILGDEDFESHYVVKPVKSDFPDALITTGDMRAFLDMRGAPHKSSDAKPDLIERCHDEGEVLIWDELVSAFERKRGNRRVITTDDYRAIGLMAANIAAHPLVRELGVLQGETEVSLVVQCPITGVWLKSRLDVLPSDTSQTDLKTTRHRKPSDRDREITDSLYFMQMAFGRHVRLLLDGTEVTDSSLIFSGKDYPHHCTHHPIGEATIAIGEILNQMAIEAFAIGMETGQWPGFADSKGYELPEFLAAPITG